MNCFIDKVAVVTGAGGTLCSCIAGDLAGKGAKVTVENSASGKKRVLEALEQ